MKIFKNQRGFTVFETVLILALIAVLGFVGYNAYKARQAQPAEEASESSSSVAEKSYTLKYEKFSLKYPSNFVLTDESQTYDEITPGADNVKLKRNGLNLGIQTGLFGIGGACEKCKVLYSQQITFLGQKAFLNFVDREATGKVSNVTLTNTAEDWFGAGIKGRNIHAPSSEEPTAELPMIISISFKDGEHVVEKTVQEFRNSADYKAAVKILESAKY